MFICLLCSNRRFGNLTAYLLHLRLRHSNEANFRVVCGISYCQREYDKYASFYKHLQRDHSELLASPSDQVTIVKSSETEDLYELDDNCEVSVQLLPCDIHKMREKLHSVMTDSMLKYSIKLRERYLLPASTHSDIMDDCKSLISTVLTNQSEIIHCHLKNQNVNVEEDLELQNMLDSNQYDPVFNECSSNYRLVQNCVKRLGMIQPKMHQIGSFKGYYVPMTDVLRMLVKKEDITPFVMRTPECDDDCKMTNFTDSEVFKTLSSSKRDGHLLLIHLYNDEFEVVNPIGAKRGKHKMNATYFTLGNLPSKYRSRLNHIYITFIDRKSVV
jgi:hypothetical protein